MVFQPCQFAIVEVRKVGSNLDRKGAAPVMPLEITLACGDYDRTRALWDGRVAIEGVALTYLRLQPEETFWRMLRHREFDVSEMSLAMYAIGRARGEMPFVAIPVFPSRCFRHSAIYVNAAAGIDEPGDLIGR